MITQRWQNWHTFSCSCHHMYNSKSGLQRRSSFTPSLRSFRKSSRPIQRCTVIFVSFTSIKKVKLVPHFPVLHFPPLHFGPAFSYPWNLVHHFPVLSVGLWSIWSLIGPSFSGPAFSIDPVISISITIVCLDCERWWWGAPVRRGCSDQVRQQERIDVKSSSHSKSTSLRRDHSPETDQS